MIRGSTQVFGVIGWPVSHSRSPSMHNAAFQTMGLDAVYVPFAVEASHLPVAVRGLRALGVGGFNVTLPHKRAIISHLDDIDDDARAMGAVNTVTRQGDRWFGSNTDAPGLLRALAEGGWDLAGGQAVVLGAGGAARATVVGLARIGMSPIVVAARDRTKAETLVATVAAHVPGADLVATRLDEGLTAMFGRTRLLVQATSATMTDSVAPPEGTVAVASAATVAAVGAAASKGASTGPEEGASSTAHEFVATLPLHALPRDAIVTDLVYEPERTELLIAAERRGLTTLGGLNMLLYQGALALESWTGKTPPLDAMRRALSKTRTVGR